VDAVGGPAVHPRLWQRRVAVLRDHGRRRLRWVVAGVSVLAVLCLGLLVLHTPLLAVRHTTVLGAVHTPEGAVVKAAGLSGHPPLVDVDPGAAARRVEQLPWVARAVVARHWPDAVTVTVTERVPLGAVARSGGGGAEVDAAGHVLAWTTGAPTGLVLVVPVAPGPPGTVLPAAARPALLVGANLPASVAAHVRRVVMGPGGSVTLDLGGGVTAVLGGTDGLRAKLEALASVLAAAAPRGPAVIDVTVPDQPTVGPPVAVGAHP